MPKKPYILAYPQLYSPSVVKMLKDMDPNEKERPLRTGDWLKTNYKSLIADISKVSEKNFSSGNQKGDIYSLVD